MKLTCGILLSTLAVAVGFQTPFQSSYRKPTTSSSITTSLHVAQEIGVPGTAKISKPWNELGFEFTPTKSNLRITYKDGAWGEMEICEVRDVNR
jgi:hypothetical protein